jgi:serine/threonine protein kinase
MGDVYLARMTRGATHEWVALKRIRADRRADPELVAQFEREAKICSGLVHPNVVSVRAWGEDAEGMYLALEYVDGRSAVELLRAANAKEERLPLEAIWTILRDVAPTSPNFRWRSLRSDRADHPRRRACCSR